MSSKRKPQVRIVLSYDAWRVLKWCADNDRDLSVGTRREFKERDRLVEIGYLEAVPSVSGKERESLETKVGVRCDRAVSRLRRRPTFAANLEAATRSISAAHDELSNALRDCWQMERRRVVITPAGRQFLKECELRVSMAGERRRA